MAKKPRTKRDGSKEIISDCRLCGSKDNLEVNSVSGKWSCWACGAGGRVKVPTGGVPTAPTPVPTTTQTTTEDLPEWVRRKIKARGLSDTHLARLQPTWNGRRIEVPVVGGPAWERTVFDWDTPKVLSRSPKGLLGLERAKPGSHIVLVEGEYKAAVIPLPWIGVAIGGKTMSRYQVGLLMAAQPGSVTILLDGGETEAADDLRKELWTMNPKVGSLPDEHGPDDVPKWRLLSAIRGAV